MFTVTLWATDTIPSLIKLGNYKHVKSGMGEMFERSVDERGAKISGRWQCDLVTLNATWTPTSHALEICSQNGWSPGKFEHLLMLGAYHPNLQRREPIVALGQMAMWEVPTYPALGMYEGERKLGLRSGTFDWSGYSFLRVREG